MPAIDDRFIATVRDLASDGDGVVEHPEGQVFFVPGVWQGERAEFRVSGFRKRFGFAEVVAMLEPSPHRTAPRCPHHGFSGDACGGCPWQFMAYPAQLEAKEARVRRALARFNADAVIHPIQGSPAVYGYRNRARLRTDGRRMGYVARGSRKLAPIQDCPILTDRTRDTLQALLATLPRNDFRPRRRNTWFTLDIDEDVAAGDVAPDIRRPFRQGNSAQNRTMRDWLGQRLDAHRGGGEALELFAGSGNFTDLLAEADFDSVLAVEGAAEAVAALHESELPGVRARQANLFDSRAVTRLGREAARAECLVLDPPRDGFAQFPALLEQCSRLEQVLYISCDLATFCRDTAELLAHHFRLAEVRPLDLFPHTPHVELMAHFERSER